MLDPTARDRALVEVAESLKEVGRTVRQRAPRAKVLFVDYLTLLPPAGTPRLRCRMSTSRSAAGSPTRWSGSPAKPPPTPAASGCAPPRPAATTTPGRSEPWTTKFGLPLPGRPAPLHPNADGMRAVADLVVGCGDLKSWVR